MKEMHSPGGIARAATATRGDGGQFMPAANPAETQRQRQHDPSSSKYQKISLKSLPSVTEWWDALAEQYPNVNLHAELLKALDWHRADRVKSPKLFFRNWVERASLSAPRVEEEPTLAQVRARLRLVV